MQRTEQQRHGAVDEMMDDGVKGKGGRGGRGGGGGGRGGSGGRGPLLLGPSRGEQNDYCQHFVDTGQRPQNFLRDVDMVCGGGLLWGCWACACKACESACPPPIMQGLGPLHHPSKSRRQQRLSPGMINCSWPQLHGHVGHAWTKCRCRLGFAR